MFFVPEFNIMDERDKKGNNVAHIFAKNFKGKAVVDIFCDKASNYEDKFKSNWNMLSKTSVDNFLY